MWRGLALTIIGRYCESELALGTLMAAQSSIAARWQLLGNTVRLAPAVARKTVIGVQP